MSSTVGAPPEGVDRGPWPRGGCTPTHPLRAWLGMPRLNIIHLMRLENAAISMTYGVCSWCMGPNHNILCGGPRVPAPAPCASDCSSMHTGQRLAGREPGSTGQGSCGYEGEPQSIRRSHRIQCAPRASGRHRHQRSQHRIRLIPPVPCSPWASARSACPSWAAPPIR